MSPSPRGKKVRIDSYTVPHNFGWFPELLKPIDTVAQVKKLLWVLTPSRISLRHRNFRIFILSSTKLIKNASLSFLFSVFKNQEKQMLRFNFPETRNTVKLCGDDFVPTDDNADASLSTLYIILICKTRSNTVLIRTQKQCCRAKY